MMKTLFFIIIVLTITACDPERTITFKVYNQTQFNTVMTLYSSGLVKNSFQIEKSKSVVIFTNSGMSPESFHTSEYDSIKFSFTNNQILVFLNDTLNTSNDIYNGENWKVETKEHTQIFSYTIDNMLFE